MRLVNEDKITLLIPYRDREAHLKEFLSKISIISPNVKIIIIEQSNSKNYHCRKDFNKRGVLIRSVYVYAPTDFNRGKLLNIGILNSDTEYVITQDVDIIPKVNTFNDLYLKDNNYEALKIYSANDLSLGGIVKFKKESLVKANGFSNEIWGWGMEDRDLHYRFKTNNMKVSKNHKSDNIVSLLRHPSNSKRRQKNRNRRDKATQIFNRKRAKRLMIYNADGLNNCHYEILKEENITNTIKKITVEI